MFVMPVKPVASVSMENSRFPALSVAFISAITLFPAVSFAYAL